MTKLDLTDAYLTRPASKRSQRYVAFQFEDKAFVFVVMPFGLNVASGRFTKVLKPAIATLRSMGIRLVIWLEDIMIISSFKETYIKHAKIVKTLLHDQSLGLFVISFVKLVLVPTQELEFLVMIVNSVTLSFSLLQRKIVAIWRNLPVHRNVQCNPTGSIAVAEAPLHYRSIQHCMIHQTKKFSLSKNQIYNKQIRPNPQSVQELKWWTTSLPDVPPNLINHLPVDYTLYTVASKKG